MPRKTPESAPEDDPLQEITALVREPDVSPIDNLEAWAKALVDQVHLPTEAPEGRQRRTIGDERRQKALRVAGLLSAHGMSLNPLFERTNLTKSHLYQWRVVQQISVLSEAERSELDALQEQCEREFSSPSNTITEEQQATVLRIQFLLLLNGADTPSANQFLKSIGLTPNITKGWRETSEPQDKPLVENNGNQNTEAEPTDKGDRQYVLHMPEGNVSAPHFRKPAKPEQAKEAEPEVSTGEQVLNREDELLLTPTLAELEGGQSLYSLRAADKLNVLDDIAAFSKGGSDDQLLNQILRRCGIPRVTYFDLLGQRKELEIIAGRVAPTVPRKDGDQPRGQPVDIKSTFPEVAGSVTPEPKPVQPEDVEQLWIEFKKDSTNTELRNRLVETYLPLVQYNGERIWARLPEGVELDDLVSAGVFGLMDAIDAFDLSRGIKFETYCFSRVRGAMFDELRNMDWVPRLVRSNASKLNEALINLRTHLGREPEDAELAIQLGITVPELEKMVSGANAVRLISLNRKWYETDSYKDVCEIDILADKRGEDPTRRAQKNDLMRLVTKGLNRNERLIIILYYYEELTMKEIGATLDLSESRVSQMHSRIVERLQKRLGRPSRRSEWGAA